MTGSGRSETVSDQAARGPQAVLRLLARERPFNHVIGSRRTLATSPCNERVAAGSARFRPIELPVCSSSLLVSKGAIPGASQRKRAKWELIRFRAARPFAVRTSTIRRHS
jgi:hypothetical protein